MDHEWIIVRNIKICHWCGVSKNTHEKTKCSSNIKLITKNGILEIIKR